MKRQGSFLVATLASLLLGAPLSAQVLRGTVRDSGSRAPIPGAVLVLLDSTGNSIGRNITNEQGRFAIALHPAMRRMQVLRIGFRPRTLSVPHSTAEELEIVMPLIPRLLDIVSVVDQPHCPRRADRPVAFALWEQTRAALLASIVTREANPADVLLLPFVRRLDRDDQILEQTVTIDSMSTSRPFIAPQSPEEFATRGFSNDSADVTWYHGPDAETMLDDAFARTYCFQIADPDRERPTHVGIAFSPARQRRGRIDIDGIAWIDTASRALTDIVFRYVGLTTALQRSRLGGRISFRTMENGAVMIDRWGLRTPILDRSPAMPSGLPAPAVRVLQTRETGGEIAHARWPDGREWKASLGTLRGTVSSGGGKGTELWLFDTDYRAIVDSAGSFEIPYLLPGPYTISAFDSALAVVDLSIATGHRFVAVRDSTMRMAVDIPSAYDYAATLCPKGAPAPGVPLLIVRVVRADGTPAAGARVAVYRVLVGFPPARFIHGNADGEGLFPVCGLASVNPRGTSFQVRADDGDQPAGGAVTTFTPTIDKFDVFVDKLFTVKIQLKPPPER